MTRMNLEEMTYALFLRCNLCDLIQALETDLSIERKSEIEEAPKPA
jgi:hypothetical protein